MSRELKSLTFEEVVDEAASGILHGILGGTKLRSATHGAIQLAAQWYKEVNAPKPRRRWCVVITIGDSTPKQRGYIYIEAGEVKKTAHDQIEIDGRTTMELCGDIKKITSRRIK